MSGPVVVFVCVRNSCRSQIAEALGRHLVHDVFESFSAGTEIGGMIDPDAVRLMKQVYGIDMDTIQYPKTLAEVPSADVVVTMGCGVACPSLRCERREDWGLEDPVGKGDAEYLRTIRLIEEKVRGLADSLR